MGLERKPLDVPKVVKISGETVVLLGTQAVTISGSMVQIESGTTVQLPSTQVVKVSGEYVSILDPSGGAVGALLVLDNNSGGTVLTSGAVTKAIIKAPKYNSADVYVGFADSTEMPYSGYGMLLEPAEHRYLDIDNLGRLRAMCIVSGFGCISYGGVTL